MLQRMVMPKLGDTMEEGTIVRWQVREGDHIEKGDVVMSVLTDKTELEVESITEGTVLKIFVAEDQTVPVGTVVAFVGEHGDEIPVEDVQAPESARLYKSDGQTTTISPPGVSTPAVDRPAEITASPRALARAKSLGVDISKVFGSGPGGRITSRDVQDYYDNHVQA